MLITSFHETQPFVFLSLSLMQLQDLLLPLCRLHNYARLFPRKLKLRSANEGCDEEKSLEGCNLHSMCKSCPTTETLALRMIRESSFAYIKNQDDFSSVACGTSRIVRSTIDVCKWQWCLPIIRFPLRSISFPLRRLSSPTKSATKGCVRVCTRLDIKATSLRERLHNYWEESNLHGSDFSHNLSSPFEMRWAYGRNPNFYWILEQKIYTPVY